MDERKPLALLAGLVVVGLAGAGVGALATTYVTDPSGTAYHVPTIATFVVVAAVVVGLAAFGTRSDRRPENPYW